MSLPKTVFWKPLHKTEGFTNHYKFHLLYRITAAKFYEGADVIESVANLDSLYCRMDQMSINSQEKSCIRYCALHSKQGIVDDLPCGVTVCWTQCSMMYTNVFFLSSPVADEADLRRRLEGIKTYVTNVQPTFPWIFYIEPELLATDLRDQSQQICLAAEFDFDGRYKCMHTTSLLPCLRPLPTSDIKFAASHQRTFTTLCC